MTLDAIRDSLPDYARDLKLNLGTVLTPAGAPGLSEQQIWAVALASAAASRNSAFTHEIETLALAHLDAAHVQAAHAAAAIMGMNNVYYRFLHLTENPKYATIPARLRMNALRTHGVDQADFELWCTAVSAINNCPACVASHEKAVREKGLSEETILASVRIAAVVHALAVVLDAVPAIA
jgi:alkyl hydroperoxide reductase subunit D